jgi:hypothetical protein
LIKKLIFYKGVPIIMQFLNADVFYLIGTYLDGYDACSCRLVCRQWKYLADRSEDLVWKRRVHLVMLERVERLELTLAGAGGGQLVPLSGADADMWLQNIFWFNYGLDARDIVQQTRANGTSLPGRLINSLFDQGEGNRGFMQNTVTKELGYVSNYYGSHTHRCFHWLGQDILSYNDETIVYHDCTPADHRVSRIQAVNAVYPGLISNWKFIHFPFIAEERFTLKTGKQDFHRGTAVYIAISPGRITDAFPIDKYLKRMEAARPPWVGMTGKGKKRRCVSHGEARSAFYDHPTRNILRERLTFEHNIDSIEDDAAKKHGSVIHTVTRPHWSKRPRFDDCDRRSYRVMPYNVNTGHVSWQ